MFPGYVLCVLFRFLSPSVSRRWRPQRSPEIGSPSGRPVYLPVRGDRINIPAVQAQHHTYIRQAEQLCGTKQDPGKGSQRFPPLNILWTGSLPVLTGGMPFLTEGSNIDRNCMKIRDWIGCPRCWTVSFGRQGVPSFALGDSTHQAQRRCTKSDQEDQSLIVITKSDRPLTANLVVVLPGP